MRLLRWIVLAVIVIGGAVGIYMLTPVRGPERDLTLAADAEHGAYLIRLGGCVTCHTSPRNRDAILSGGLGLKTPFGTFYPPNITSSKTDGIGDWTLQQFSDAMSNGEGPEGHFYPAFPYDSYTLMSDQEIVDLYAALQQVPAVDTASKPHDVGFPFNIRLAMAGWKHLFFSPRRYVADASKSDEWNRGRYIVMGPGHCVSCHSPRNILGGLESGKELTGSGESSGPGGKAPALTKAALEKVGYTPELLTQTLITGEIPGGDSVAGTMGEVVRDETSQWTDADRAAVVTYLLGAN